MSIFKRRGTVQADAERGSRELHRHLRQRVLGHLEVLTFLAETHTLDREAIRTYVTMAERLEIWSEEYRNDLVVHGPSMTDLKTDLVEVHGEHLQRYMKALRELRPPEPEDVEVLRHVQSATTALIAHLSGAQSCTPRTYCHVCGSTDGPFTLEPWPPGLTQAPPFARCMRCTQERHLGHVNVQALLPTWATAEELDRNFVPCAGCGALFWSQTRGVAYPWERFDVERCPVCGHALPRGESVAFADPGYATAHSSGFARARTVEETREAFARLTRGLTENRALSAAVTEVLLIRKDDEHHGLVVIGRGLDRTGATLLGKLSGLFFGSSVRADDRDDYLAREGLELLETWAPPASR